MVDRRVVQPTGLTAAITPVPVAPALVPSTSATSTPTSTSTFGRGLGTDGDSVRSAAQQALETDQSKSSSLEASSIIRVTRSASTDASSGGEGLEMDLPGPSGKKDPWLHIVDGGVQLRGVVPAGQK